MQEEVMMRWQQKIASCQGGDTETSKGCMV